MRYTTVIDVTEMRGLMRNQHAAWLYLVMALKSGYHDDDRDLLSLSERQLGYVSGLTYSAVRHCLALLKKEGLIEREIDGRWRVKKWLPDQPISPRNKSKKQQSEETAALERALNQEKRSREWEERQRNRVSYEEYLASKNQIKISKT